MQTAVDPYHVLVTGAEGFVARGLLERHLRPLAAAGKIRLSTTDLQGHDREEGTMRHRSADIRELSTWDWLFTTPVHMVFHLAAVVSGQAERDPSLSLQVNLQAALIGLERCRMQHARGGPKVRWLQASSIGVWGTGLPRRVDDAHPVRPALSYGTHKRMIELMLHDLSRRGEVDGRSLRLSGVVVRPKAHGTALSAFNSDLIREPLQGRTITCPVRPDACLWLCSRETSVDQLWALSQIDELAWRSAHDAHGTDSVVNAPTWAVRVETLLQAMAQLDARAASRVHFDPAAPLQAAFGNWPLQADFGLARTLGLPADTTRHHDDLARFIQASMCTA